MNIKVIGAGAMGMMVAARLYQAGLQVTLAARTFKQAEEIREHGVQLTMASKDGTEVNKFVQVPTCTMDQLERDKTSDISLLLLMVKQTSITESFARALVEHVTPSTSVYCFQNGTGHLELLQSWIPSRQIGSVVTTEGALKISSRHVKHTGRGETWIGNNPSSSFVHEANNTAEFLKNLLNHAGFSAFVSNNINSRIWDKLIINAVINPLTAILQLRNGQLHTLPALVSLMRTLYEEATLLADHLGYELSPDLWEQIENVCKRTANNESSMLQDIHAGRLTEIDAITGGLLRTAERSAVQLPTHATLYYMIRSIEQQWKLI